MFRLYSTSYWWPDCKRVIVQVYLPYSSQLHILGENMICFSDASLSRKQDYMLTHTLLSVYL